VDASLKNDSDVVFEAVQMESIIRLIEQSAPVRVLVFDSCRNNPFGGRSISVSTGLDTIDPRIGTYLAYSTAPGDVSVDGPPEGSSPFAAAFVKELDNPPADIDVLFRRVRSAVYTEVAPVV
jgi:uncharacterized caspase-like protein